MSQKLSVMLIGAGAMGGAMLKGWLASDLLDAERSFVVDPFPASEIEKLTKDHGIEINPPAETPADICVLAIKPQQFASVVPGLAWPDMAQTLFVSVAAGVSIKTMRQHLAGTPAANAPMIRAMPNLGVMVGRGVTVLYGDETVSAAHRDAVDAMAHATGSGHWLGSEDHIDAATAISGSGPAYIFLLAEAMAEAGEEIGLSPDLALKLANETVTGAALLLDHDERSAADLRKAVTSPGGTTAAALSVLDGDEGFRKLLKQAAQKAKARAIELAG